MGKTRDFHPFSIYLRHITSKHHHASLIKLHLLTASVASESNHPPEWIFLPVFRKSHCPDKNVRMFVQQFGQTALPFGTVGNDVHEHIEHGCLGIECIVAPQLFLICPHNRFRNSDVWTLLCVSGSVVVLPMNGRFPALSCPTVRCAWIERQSVTGPWTSVGHGSHSWCLKYRLWTPLQSVRWRPWQGAAIPCQRYRCLKYLWTWRLS